MRISTHSLARRIARLSRAARAQLRCGLRHMISTLLIGISLGGPLLCILHCQVWLPLMLGQHAAMAHHHHMPGVDTSRMADMAGMSMSNMDMASLGMAGM